MVEGEDGQRPVIGHDHSGPEAATLCDRLASALRQRLPDLEVGRSQNWCCFALSGKTRFAFLKHKRRQARVEVWFAGDHELYGQENSLDIRPRQETRGGFGPTFRARFDVASAVQVQEAAELLFQVSCPVSHAKGRRGRPAYGVKATPTEDDRSDEATGRAPQQELSSSS